ncbi:MAG: dihydrofolate reductase [Gammaproteobacteria bacterium]|jgi:dihydrofolate reductase|tara:strand:+ start:494 stop:1000 length:507 start_codon:yes stop_codon:yes gene_type:complete
MKLALICAMSENRVIGRDNGLPWHLSEDLKYFRRTTMGNCMIMGRNTWESIGRALPGRTSIVITSNADYQAEGAEVVGSLQQAIERAEAVSKETDSIQAFVIGGAVLYQTALPLADTLHLTRVHAQVEGDTILHEFDESNWKETSREQYQHDESNQYDYSICVMQRIS